MNFQLKATSNTDQPHSLVDQAWQQAEIAIGQTRQTVRKGNVRPSEFDWVQAALESLPISQQEFAVAQNRLHNAKAYFYRGEVGAAVFELNLLYGGISREAKCTITPAPKKSRY